MGAPGPAGRLAEQQQMASRLQRLEYLIGALVGLMVAGVILYGRKLNRNMQAMADERNRLEREWRAASRMAGMAEVAANLLHTSATHSPTMRCGWSNCVSACVSRACRS